MKKAENRQLKQKDSVRKGLVGVVVDITGISGADNNAKGLFYRGYEVRELADNCDYLEIVYLLLNGDLPNKKQYKIFQSLFFNELDLSSGAVSLIKKYAKKAKLSDLIFACLAVFKLESVETKNFYDTKDDCDDANKILIKIIAKITAIIGATCRIRSGNGILKVSQGFNLSQIFLIISLGINDKETANYINKIMVLAADNGMTASTFIARGVISSGSDIYDAVSAALASFKGHAHGGASADVLEMLRRLQNENDIDVWVKKQLKSKKKIPGFGHRLYKNGDPRLDSLEEGFNLLEKYNKDNFRKT